VRKLLKKKTKRESVEGKRCKIVEWAWRESGSEKVISAKKERRKSKLIVFN
jgi:hypothetical protein